MAGNKKKAPKKTPKAIEERWTKPLTDAGWTALPNVILDKQVALGLEAMDLNILLQMIKFWWRPGSEPFPSVKTLAQAIGVSTRTIQRHTSRMEQAGLLERESNFYSQGGQRSNTYKFDGLIEACGPFAEEIVAGRQKKALEEAARIRRKKPLLKAVE